MSNESKPVMKAEEIIKSVYRCAIEMYGDVNDPNPLFDEYNGLHWSEALVELRRTIESCRLGNHVHACRPIGCVVCAHISGANGQLNIILGALGLNEVLGGKEEHVK